MSMEDTELEELPAVQEEETTKGRARDAQLCNLKKVRDQAIEFYESAAKGYEDQNDRFNDTMDYWDVYNCKLNQKQFYDGNSKVYVPIVHAAIEARKTRFSNQLFPQSERYVEVTSTDQTVPYPQMALAEHYVRLAQLKTKVVPALLRNGDVEGQYTIYASWEKRTRWIASKVSKPAMIDDMGTEDPDETVEDIEEEEVKDGFPNVEVIADADLCVMPATADSLDEAIAGGGLVCIARRWTKGKIKTMMASKAIDKKEGQVLLDRLTDSVDTRKDKASRAIMAAGVRKEGRGAYALVYEIWGLIDTGDGDRLCQMFFAGADNVLSVKRNPYWSDALPIKSVPVQKIQGSFKGQSPVKPVADFQYMANDACNEGMDNMHYALMPIVMTDPEKNPRLGTMVLSMAAIWQTSPNDTQFAKFPELWKDALEIVASAEGKIMQVLSVNSAMMSQGGPYRKPTQAEIAAEQQVDILTTADAVTVIEEGILTPLIQLFVEMDAQYRDKEITVRQYGALGLQAEMREVPLIQLDRRYQFRWFGVEAARTVQQIQQQIAALNVIRGVPPQLYPGYILDVAPMMVQIAENAFGPRLAPLTFKDVRSQLSMDPETENELMSDGVEMPVHPMDDHQMHMNAHIQEIKATRDPTGTLRQHMLQHQKLMAEMAQAQVAAQGGMPGQAQGPGSGPPRMGAQPDMIRNVQNPPGAIPVDNMQDPGAMPRRVVGMQ